MLRLLIHHQNHPLELFWNEDPQDIYHDSRLNSHCQLDVDYNSPTNSRDREFVNVFDIETHVEVDILEILSNSRRAVIMTVLYLLEP